jgi:hypothetical protein
MTDNARPLDLEVLESVLARCLAKCGLVASCWHRAGTDFLRLSSDRMDLRDASGLLGLSKGSLRLGGLLGSDSCG